MLPRGAVRTMMAARHGVYAAFVQAVAPVPAHAGHRWCVEPGPALAATASDQTASQSVWPWLRNQPIVDATPLRQSALRLHWAPAATGLWPASAAVESGGA